jgi:hypothetical protein
VPPDSGNEGDEGDDVESYTNLRPANRGSKPGLGGCLTRNPSGDNGQKPTQSRRIITAVKLLNANTTYVNRFVPLRTSLCVPQ